MAAPAMTGHERTEPRPPEPSNGAASNGAGREHAFGRALDFVSDWSLVAYATWTLIAYGGMLTEARVSVLFPIWLVAVPLLAGALVLLVRRWPPQRAPLPEPRRLPRPLHQRRSAAFAASVGAGLAAGVLAGVALDVPWPLVWLLLFTAVALAVAIALTRPFAAVRERAQGLIAHLFAAGVGMSFAGLSLLVVRGSADDVYYVNRATATAQLDHIPVRDVLITNEQADPASGVGLPVDTFSALQGAVARFFDVHAASVAYYVTPPFFTFLATWALWRLLRTWAARAAVVCFALGCVYWLFTSQDNLTAGSYFLGRMWQGKVIFVAWLVPTLYVHFTRWLHERDAVTATLLLAGGVSSIGLTGSATFVAPLLFSTAALALLVRRDWRGLPVVLAAAAIPFVIGLAVTLNYPLDKRFTHGPAESDYVFTEVFALGVVAAVATAALCCSPWLVRSAWAAWITSALAVITVVLLAPGVIPAVGDISGLTRTLRRTLWILPLPALVGLLAALPLPRLLLPRLPFRAAALAPAVAVAVLLVAFGQPIWVSESGERRVLKFPPTWKSYAGAARDARAILGRYNGPGPILADDDVMKAIAIVTVSPKAVNPREWYVKLIPGQGRRTEQRLQLTRFVEGEEPVPAAQAVRRALADVRVDLVCLRMSQPDLIAEIQSAGPYREAFEVREYVCLERQA